MRYSKT
jgi:RNase P subunit RPR2